MKFNYYTLILNFVYEIDKILKHNELSMTKPNLT